MISLARVALCTGAHEPLFCHLRTDSNAMNLLYESASLLTYTYIYRQRYTKAHENSYVRTFSAVVSRGALRALRLHGLHHHTTVYATYNALMPLFRDATLIVMNFWAGGIRRTCPQWADFPIIAEYLKLKEFQRQDSRPSVSTTVTTSSTPHAILS